MASRDHCRVCSSALRPESRFCPACGASTEILSPAAPVETELPQWALTQQAPPNPPPRRLMIIAITVSLVLLVGGGLIGLLVLRDSGERPPVANGGGVTAPTAPSPQTQTDQRAPSQRPTAPPSRAARTIPLTSVAIVGRGSGRCFGPRRGAYVILSGTRYAQNFLQCGDDRGDLASGRFVVNVAGLISGGEITGFSATVGIDEASDGDAVRADWSVTYNGQPICEVRAVKGAPTTCEADGLAIPVVPSGRLVLSQTVASSDPNLSLWATFHDARLHVNADVP